MRLFKFLIPFLLIPSLAFASASRNWGGGTGSDKIVVAWGNNPTSNAWSATSWVNATAFTGALNNIIFQQADGVGTGRTILGVELNSGSWKLYNATGGTSIYGTTNFNSSLGIWHFVSLTISGGGAGSTRRIYVDSVQENSGTITPESSTGNLLIGQHKSPSVNSKDWDGKLSMGKTYKKELTVVEIQELMWKPEAIAGGNTFNPIWGDSTEIDLSGNGKTGAVTGTSTSSDGPPVMFGSGLPL